MKTVPLGEILRLDRRRLEPQPREEYHYLGVRSFGKGMIEYGPTLGSDLPKVTYFRIPADALVLSNIKAWEGAVAVSLPEHANFATSQRLLAYRPITGEVDVRYVYHFLLSDAGLEALGRASPGSADRNRTLGRAALEAIPVPLPPLDEQRQIVARLDAAAELSKTVTVRTGRVATEVAELAEGLFDKGAPPVLLSQVLTETSRFEKVDPARNYASAGVRWYAEGVFGRPPRPASEIKASKLNRLVEGEFIYNRLFAWKGSFALTPGDDLWVSNEFPTFRVDESKVLREYLLGWFSLPETWSAVERLSTGATPTSRNRLKQNELLGMSIPLPPLDRQADVSGILLRLRAVRATNASRGALADALPQAARNFEFSTLR